MDRADLTLCFLAVLISGCGIAGAGAPPRTTSMRQALNASPELLELEPLAVRQELYREVERTSLVEARFAATGPVLFPLIQNGSLRAAPGLESRGDLLLGPDGGEADPLALEVSGAERWPEERRESLQGLSEREAAELIARSLLLSWNVHARPSIRVERAVGAPYAVAYADGVLRVNPSFLYLAASAGMSPGVTASNP